MTQVPKNPPPWGPARDPHFEPTHQFEAVGIHDQASASEAADRGWYYRAEWYLPLVPDTRRCKFHGEIMFEPLPLTAAEMGTYYRDQRRGMATGPIG
jgi:hypothetical protein